MRKSFWEEFREGFRKAAPYGLAFTAGAFYILALEYIFPDPYTQCRAMYSNPTDIMVCIWILENP